MNRRDFLSLRAGPRGQTLELSCERLYMRCLDARVGVEPDGGEEYQHGEPPAVIDRRTPADLIQELERDLARANVLRVVDRQWMANDDLGRHVDALVSSFRARGGRVEFA